LHEVLGEDLSLDWSSLTGEEKVKKFTQIADSIDAIDVELEDVKLKMSEYDENSPEYMMLEDYYNYLQGV